MGGEEGSGGEGGGEEVIEGMKEVVGKGDEGK